MTTDRRKVEFDFGGGPVTFGTQEEAKAWLAMQRDAFAWLQDLSTRIDIGFVAAAQRKYNSFFNSFEYFADHLHEYGDEDAQRRFNELMNEVIGSGGIVTTASPAFAIVEQADGQISAAERTLILAPLFRPTSDGIVKDDSAPALSLPAALAGMLDRQHGR